MNRRRTTFGINPITSVGVIAILFCVFSNVNSYSKYGRGCMDIGCLPNEVCVMSHDSCNFGQRDGKECGSFPTCQRNGNSGPTGNGGGVKPSDHDATSSHSSSPVQNSNVPSGNGGGFSSGGHNLYPSLPNNNPSPPQGGYQPPANAGGGYQPPPYNNPYGGYNNPGMGGGYNGGYNGGAGGYNGGYGGGGGYNGGGGYQPAPQPPKKDEGNGFFTNLLNQAASQYINGQIQRVLSGGGGGQQPQQPSGGYGNGGGSGTSSGSGSSFLNSFLGNVLSGGGGNQPPRSSSSGSGGLGFLGDILNSRGGGGGGGGGGISEILGSRNFGGLFNEKTPSSGSGSSQSSYSPTSNGPKSYPTQPPPYGSG